MFKKQQELKILTNIQYKNIINKRVNKEVAYL